MTTRISSFQNLYGRGRGSLEFLQVTEALIENHSLYGEGESLLFFEVPGLLYREKVIYEYEDSYLASHAASLF